MPPPNKFSEDQLCSIGFKKGTDGVWRKEGSAPPNPPSGTDPEQPKDKPKRRKRTPSKTAPVRRLVAIVTVRTVRPRDYDGLGASSKHYMDALQSIGLYQDDAPEYLEVLAVAERVGSFREEETLIELWEIPKLIDSKNPLS